MKTKYIEPAVKEIKVIGDMSLMGTSTEEAVIPGALHDDITVGGDQSLSRRRSDIWFDEEEEEDF